MTRANQPVVRRVSTITHSKHLSRFIRSYLNEDTKAVHRKIGFAPAAFAYTPLFSFTDGEGETRPFKFGCFGFINHAIGRPVNSLGDLSNSPEVVERILNFWRLQTERQKRKAIHLVFSLPQEILHQINQHRYPVDGFLLNCTTRALSSFNRGFYPHDNLSYLVGVHHDTDNPHAHILLFPKTALGRQVNLSNNQRVRIAEREIRVDYLGGLQKAFEFSVGSLTGSRIPRHPPGASFQYEYFVLNVLKHVEEQARTKGQTLISSLIPGSWADCEKRFSDPSHLGEMFREVDSVARKNGRIGPPLPANAIPRAIGDLKSFKPRRKAVGRFLNLVDSLVNDEIDAGYTPRSLHPPGRKPPPQQIDPSIGSFFPVSNPDRIRRSFRARKEQAQKDDQFTSRINEINDAASEVFSTFRDGVRMLKATRVAAFHALDPNRINRLMRPSPYRNSNVRLFRTSDEVEKQIISQLDDYLQERDVATHPIATARLGSPDNESNLTSHSKNPDLSNPEPSDVDGPIELGIEFPWTRKNAFHSRKLLDQLFQQLDNQSKDAPSPIGTGGK